MSNFDEAKGKVKQAAGDLTDNNRLKNEGRYDEAKGKAKNMADRVSDKIEDLIPGDSDRDGH